MVVTILILFLDNTGRGRTKTTMVLSLFPIEEMKNFCVDSCFRSIIVLFDESRLILFSHINSARDSGWLVTEPIAIFDDTNLFIQHSVFLSISPTTNNIQTIPV